MHDLRYNAHADLGYRSHATRHLCGDPTMTVNINGSVLRKSLALLYTLSTRIIASMSERVVFT